LLSASIGVRLNFGARYAEVYDKQKDKAVRKILEGLAALDLESEEVNAVMNEIAEYSKDVEYHTGDDN
jgi:hypothetical protein